ncbi:Aste57867_676 [Aphanomyces stellatus]|uniref:Aste57867_676 protein n=1 Tax=Aphanomyces stellatus TaxID=120398 RepID=A0A485K3K8_9STRA|nr:hypothetical protein As57867_000675 [Aphanomyces stellatus]VFT77901.1 Aste57867_676 [Aphanomyces stellatus]
MKLSVFALFAVVAAALALKNDVALDDAVVAAGAEFYESLDEDDQVAIDAWVASQVDDDDDSQIDDQAIVDAWVANQLNDDNGDDSKGGDDNGN